MAPSFFSSKNKLDSPGPVEKLWTRDHYDFKFNPLPIINVSSPDCGPSGQVGNLNSIATADSPAELFPTLTWHFEVDEKDEVLAQRLNRIKEYLLIVQDLDAGKLGSSPKAIGIYYVIPPHKTTISANDIVKDKKGRLEWIRVAERGLVGGFKYADMDGKVWRPPKSMHRIHFQVIALSRTVDSGSLSEFATVGGFRGESEGSMIGWGEWVGIYEKK
ncbi:hypothetical protein L207DRAFT_506079 [Hyaloscypha variabilis F]|jgi:hypothetical protein|uniref:Uncharacterized protein n=1 Tax=Hyaloscypha variabilis (strain UAMH 11265 / GT02V1 / F) TaxID=1149755 RepID=A0A2J6S8C5_HYAVF|nr:hypothetical protein L207DRAFT_506079 [Hyaloscypha variabilis F]